MSQCRLEDLFDRFRRDGDAGALASVFDETAPELLRLARHLVRDAAEAEDLVQATFVAAIEKRHAFDGARRLQPWLVGILLKQASLARRARSRAIDPDRLDSRTVQDPLDTIAAREVSEALTVALEKLSPADREVLLPLLLDGKRAVQIARELDQRADTVHMRIHRGLRRLRRLLPASFALGALARSGQARGLGALRAEVLRHARIEVGATAGAAAVALVPTGVVLMTNKIALAAIALVLCVGATGYLLTTNSPPADSNSVASTAGIPTDGAPSGAQTSSDPTAPGSQRTGASNTLANAFVVRSVDGLLEIELVEEDGLRPARGLQTVLVDATGAVQVARADERGRCTFTASADMATAGTGAVYVRRADAFPHYARVELAPGVRRIVLPRGRELSGRIELVGAQSPPPIELRLSTDIAPEGFAEASKEVFAALDLMKYGVRKLLAGTVTQLDGTFRFEALPETWSGSLLLPKEFVFVVESIATRTSERVVRKPSSGLSLSVAYRPRIVGRLIDAANREPIRNIRDISFDCTLIWPDGNNTICGGRADGEGRFTIPLEDRTDPVGLYFDTVRLSDGRIARSSARRTWNRPEDPYDAGDVECAFPVTRVIAFRAVDSDGRPLAGARAKIGELGPLSADAQGIGRFPAVPLDSSEMRVVARGHAVATVPLAGENAPLVEVRLSPTNRLTVVLPREVAGRKDLRLCLSSKEPLFGGTAQAYDWVLRNDMVGRFLSAKASERPGEREIGFAFSPSGEVELEDLRPGVPFRLCLRGYSDSVASRVLRRGSADSNLAEVEVRGLDPDEQRRLDLRLEPAQVRRLKVVDGRAVDSEGRPILGAQVHAQSGFGLNTDFNGHFRLELIDRDTVDIEVAKRGFVPFRVQGWDTSSVHVLEARLVRGHDLRVHVVDAQDRTIDDARVHADIRDFGPAGRIEHDAPGRFVLCDLPPGMAEITVEVGGRKYVRTHDTRAGIARIELPLHGALEVAWNLPDPAAEQGQQIYRRLALRPKSAEGQPLFHELHGLQTAGTHTFANLFPGEYTLAIESGIYDALFEDVPYAPTGSSHEITIVAGATKLLSTEP